MLKKDQFFLPENTIYLDGNSLGPLPKAAIEIMHAVLQEEWGELLISAWNKAGWMDLPQKLGDRIAPIIGASKGTVTTGDTLSVKMVQALHAALQLNPTRRVVLSDNGNFPSDLYMAQGLLDALGGFELRVVEPETVQDALDDEVSVMMLTHVDYRTGRMHDMEALTRRAHEVGALAIWDLAHSAGCIDLEIERFQVDMAAGCCYKYLNGGPGAPAFIYIHPKWVNQIRPILSGWLGHKAPFDFDLDYQPKFGIERMRVGTPPILQMRTLESSLKIFEDVDMSELRQRSLELTDMFIQGVESIGRLEVVTPKTHRERGSQVSIKHEHAFAIVQSLIDQGVVGDFRAPNIARFGFTPLYIDGQDVLEALSRLQMVMDNELYRYEKYQVRGKVT